MKGIVIKSTGSWYLVKTSEGEIYPCRLKGRLRLSGVRTTNPVAVGDVVDLILERSDGENTPIEGSETVGVITAIEPRRNYIIRRSTNLSKESHILAANIDTAFLVVTISHPEVPTAFIDRFLAATEAYRIPAVLVFNKIDLLDETSRPRLEALTALYRTIGYRVLEVSARTGEGMAQWEAACVGCTSMVAGQSGVGKSTLINTVEPGLGLKVGEISASHDQGRHTTTFAEMFPLSKGGYIIDTPGIRAFGNLDMKSEEISHYFVEIFRTSAQCRYGNCTHTHEPGCAVMEALVKGEIADSRYESYLGMLEEGENAGKYR